MHEDKIKVGDILYKIDVNVCQVFKLIRIHEYIPGILLVRKSNKVAGAEGFDATSPSSSSRPLRPRPAS